MNDNAREGSTMPNPNPIRAAIAEAMARRGVTQTQLARLSGTSQPKVSRFLAGKSVSVETVGRMVSALGLCVRDDQAGSLLVDTNNDAGM